MKKMLNQNKGFSLIELLVAILIMAVIAGTAIMLFGGVLNSSRESADQETAENIKRAILTYMNMTNDTNLSCLGADNNSTSINSSKVIYALACKIDLGKSDASKVQFTVPDNAKFQSSDLPTESETKIESSDIKGTYGPYLDATKDMNPTTPGTVGWRIEIDEDAQVVIVKAVTDDDPIVFIN